MWLAELDCSASNFKGNFYVIFEWDDYRLKFPYEDFGASMFHETFKNFISILDKTQIPAKDIWVPDMDIMSLTSVGESSKIEKELVTIRKTGRVSVFKRIFYEGTQIIRDSHITVYSRLLLDKTAFLSI